MSGWPSLVRRWTANPMIPWISRVQIPSPAFFFFWIDKPCIATSYQEVLCGRILLHMDMGVLLLVELYLFFLLAYLELYVFISCAFFNDKSCLTSTCSVNVAYEPK